MHRCTITATTGEADLAVVIADRLPRGVPRLVRSEAKRIRATDKAASTSVTLPEQRWLVVRTDPREWLAGGETWRLAGKAVVGALREQDLASARLDSRLKPEEAQALAEGAILADYRFDIFKNKSKKRRGITVRLPGQRDAVRFAGIVAQAQNRARELLDLPPNELNPRTFVTRLRSLFRRANVELKVTQGLKALEKARFPGLIQVGRAGSTEPALVEIHYRPATRGDRQLAFVGKGITFDSGGISIKPTKNMSYMKADMGGAAAVAGAMLMIAKQKPKIPVSAYVALAENLPGSRAQRPGDIYTARNGKSVHIDTTDAEGRLIMSDVLTYACEKGATHIIDLATLTGACMVALGNSVAGLMANDAAWSNEVRAAGIRAGEEFWPLPLYGEYRELLDHPHADLNNVGGRYGGTITAGIFLSEFVNDGVLWAHGDIAGKAFKGNSAWRYYAKGATAFGARTLAQLAMGMQ